MDLSSLEATFEANKTPILAAAGAGVVGLGLYAKKKKATTSASGGGTTAAGGASSGGQTAGMTGGAAYDSSASDLYGAIQPQLESLGGQLTDLRNLYASTPPAPTPVPAPTPAPTSTTTGTTAPSTSATPTPVYATAADNYLVSSNQAAGGTATWSAPSATATANGYSAGVISSTASPASSQHFFPYAIGPNLTGLMSQESLPTNGSAGPVGTVTPDGFGGYQAVTGYTFNGAPSWQKSTATGHLIGFDGKPV